MSLLPTTIPAVPEGATPDLWTAAGVRDVYTIVGHLQISPDLLRCPAVTVIAEQHRDGSFGAIDVDVDARAGLTATQARNLAALLIEGAELADAWAGGHGLPSSFNGPDKQTIQPPSAPAWPCAACDAEADDARHRATGFCGAPPLPQGASDFESDQWEPGEDGGPPYRIVWSPPFGQDTTSSGSAASLCSSSTARSAPRVATPRSVFIAHDEFTPDAARAHAAAFVAAVNAAADLADQWAEVSR